MNTILTTLPSTPTSLIAHNEASFLPFLLYVFGNKLTSLASSQILMYPFQVKMLHIFLVLPNGMFYVKLKSNGDKTSPFIQVILNWKCIRQLRAYPYVTTG